LIQSENELFLLRLVSLFFFHKKNNCYSTTSNIIKQALQTLTILCRAGKLVQEILIQKKVFSLLCKFIIEYTGELRQWATNGLLSLCVRQYALFQSDLKNPEFRKSLKLASEKEDWTEWSCNEAAELETLIELIR
jgi:hypothetical protein